MCKLTRRNNQFEEKKTCNMAFNHNLIDANITPENAFSHA